jgi:aspartate aminotransferase
MNLGLNPLLKDIKPSATLVINELSAQLLQKGQEVYKFGFGQSPFPVPRPLIETLKLKAAEKDYLPVRGLPILRNAIADFHHHHHGLNFTGEDVLVAPGSKELIYDFLLCADIQEVLIPAPSWVSYEPQSLLTGRKVSWLYGTLKNSWKLSPNILAAHCRISESKNKALILNYPSNPLGISYTANELNDLTKVFKKENIVVISDEIYGELHHEGQHCSLSKIYPKGTVVTSGLSKWAGAGGWRLGYALIPKNLHHILEAMSIVASETFTTTSAPIQYAAVKAFELFDTPEIQDYVHKARAILKGIGYYVYGALKEAGVDLSLPEGGFYLYPDFEKWRAALAQRGINNSEDFCTTLLKETGVALLAGSHFGHNNGPLTARLSYVDFDGALAMNKLQLGNIKVDKEFVGMYCPKIVNGVAKLIQWLNDL